MSIEREGTAHSQAKTSLRSFYATSPNADNQRMVPEGRLTYMCLITKYTINLTLCSDISA